MPDHGDYSDYRYIHVEVRDAIAFLTIDSADEMNACDLDEHGEFPRILRQLARDDDVRVAVVTGAGRAFSIGGNLELLEHMAQGPAADAERLFADARDLVLAHVDLDKPIVAAINGWAMGSGTAFALLCDYIVMEEQAKLADGHTRAALAAGDGGAVIWPLAVGMTAAKRYLLTGDAIDAAEAHRIGLVTEVVAEGDSLTRATEVATRLAAGPQLAIRYTKRALNQWLRMGVATAFDYSLALEVRTMGSPETSEAIRELQRSGTPAIPPDPRRKRTR